MSLHSRQFGSPTKVPEVTLGFWIIKILATTLGWAGFILTRPLGATVGDFLDKPLDQGGLALSRPIASVVIAASMIGFAIPYGLALGLFTVHRRIS